MSNKKNKLCKEPLSLVTEYAEQHFHNKQTNNNETKYLVTDALHVAGSLKPTNNKQTSTVSGH